MQDGVNQLKLSQFIHSIQAVTNLPLVAGGGIGSRVDVYSLLSLGLEVVQEVTFLLLSDEADTSQIHRGALQSAIADTSLTQVFTECPPEPSSIIM